MKTQKTNSMMKIPAILGLILCLLGPNAGYATCPVGYGDVTGDGARNVVDTQCLILVSLWALTGHLGPAPACMSSLSAADLSCDGAVNVVDVQISITLALNQALAASLDPNGNGCPDTCESAECGDGVLNAGEECDDGNDVAGDGCEPDCTLTPGDNVCGDGELAGNEECDDGNLLNGDGCNSNCQIEVRAPQFPGDLVITEMLINPFVVPDNVGEWFEIYNPTAFALNLLGVAIVDEGVDAHTIAQPVIVPPGAYALLGRSGDPLVNGGVVPDYVYTGFSLGNVDDEILIVASGVLIDRVAYDLSWGVPNGASLSLNQGALNAADNDLPENWCEAFTLFGAGDFGTPGAVNPDCPVCGDGLVEGAEQCDDGTMNSNLEPDACRTNCRLPRCGDGVADTGEECDDGNNSNGDGCENDCTLSPPGPECGNGVVEAGEQCDDGNLQNGDGCSAQCTFETGDIGPGSLIITEIMQNPLVVADNVGEWFEVYNPGNVAVDMNGLRLKDNGTNNHLIVGSVVVPPMGYAVLANNGNPAINGGVAPNYVFPTSYQLGNNSDAIRIELADGTLVDQVTWDGGNTFPSPNGRSMNLDPGAYDVLLNDLGANWCLSFVQFGAGDYGSPGQPNPACPECGNGITEGFETCDDGPLNSDTEPDACRTNCRLPRCGDGIVDSAEECDDGNQLDGDGCEADCTLPEFQECGNGVVEGSEECDWGAENDDLTPDACRTDCMLPRCGDSVVDSGEECDDGNTASGDGCSAACAIEAAPPGPGALVITEIMQNPAVVADNLGEWFEVYNPGDAPIDMGGMVLKDNGTNVHVIASSLIVPAKGFVVFANNGNPLTNGGIPLVDYVFPAQQYALGNASDAIRIELPDGTLIDQVSWDDGATFPDPNGRSMSLDPAFWNAVANDVGAHWCEGVTPFGLGDFGTPGAMNPECVFPECGDGVIEGQEECDDGVQNSDTEPDACRTDCRLPRCGDGVIDLGEECDDGNITPGDGCSATCDEEIAQAPWPLPGEVIVSEVMYDPAKVADNVGEWFEVFNLSLLDLELGGLRLKDNGTNNHLIVGSVIIPAGGYLVFANNGDPLVNGGVAADYVFPTTYQLGNTSDAIRIELPNGTLIDAVAWDNGATFPKKAGEAMSLDPGSFSAAANDLGANWCLATTPYGLGDLGSPGTANPSCAGPPNATFADVQPILQAKCGGCHTGAMFCSGDTCFASNYSDTQTNAFHPSCSGLTVAECILVRVQDGSMPLGGGCTGDPALDVAMPHCLNQSEQDLLQSWLDGGALP